MVHFFHLPLPIAMDLPWFRINQAMKRVPLVERAQAVRSEARQMAELIVPPRRPSSHRPGTGCHSGS